MSAFLEDVKLRPDNSYSWFNLGVALENLGRHQEAAAAFLEALKLQPDDVKAWNNLAVAYALLGERSKALQAARELRRYDPRMANRLYDLILGR